MQRITMIDATSSSFATSPFDLKDNEAETTVQHRLERLQPIPLSDSILRQCCFVYHDYFKFWQLVAGLEETRSEMDIDRDYNIIDFMRKPVVKKVSSPPTAEHLFYAEGKRTDFSQRVATRNNDAKFIRRINMLCSAGGT